MLGSLAFAFDFTAVFSRGAQLHFWRSGQHSLRFYNDTIWGTVVVEATAQEFGGFENIQEVYFSNARALLEQTIIFHLQNVTTFNVTRSILLIYDFSSVIRTFCRELTCAQICSDKSRTMCLSIESELSLPSE